MLETPYIIKEKKCSVDKLYEENDIYVKVFLPLDLNVTEDNVHILVNNHIVKSIIEKYNDKLDFFKSISFNKDQNLELDYNFPLFNFSLYKDIQKEFENIDILIMDYEKLDLKVRKYINDLIRVHCVCRTGKLLFHIVSELRFFDFLKQGYRFETYCDKEVLLMNHEIQQLRIHNGIMIDDYGF